MEAMPLPMAIIKGAEIAPVTATDASKEIKINPLDVKIMARNIKP